MLKELLIEKGFVENLDFTLVGEELTALERTRDVEIVDEQGNVSIGQETYLVQLPSVDALKLELVKRNDPAILIGEYLKDKNVQENDSLNVDLFLNGGPGWRFEAVLPPSISELYALIAPVSAAKSAEDTRQARIAAGAAARQACQQVLDLISGFNLEQQLTIEQITIMQQNFELAERALRAGRPTLAKGAIQAIVPDGVIVTQEMKDEALALLAGY